jgi:elongation factor G
MPKPGSDLSMLRNIGIIAHIDAGKTTVSERVLLFSGRIRVAGEVHKGTTTMDWMPDERERGITITAAATSVAWRDRHINVIDTPGHVDFTAEVERALRVLDGAIGVFDGKHGVEAQSETVWRQADRYRVPRLAFINKLDAGGADFQMSVDSIREKLGAHPVVVALPWGTEGGLRGVIDVVHGRALTFEGDAGEHVVEHPVPDDQRDALDMAREELVNEVTERAPGARAEALVERVLAGVPLTAADLQPPLRAATLAGAVVPVFCGSALKNIGIQPLLDGVVDYLPSPLDVPPAVGQAPHNAAVRVERPSDPNGPFAALAFKVFHDRYGDLIYTRLYSGTLATGAQVWNPRVKKAERVAKIFAMHADHRDERAAARAGEIVALVGLRFTATGDTLCDKAHPVLFEPPLFPQTVVTRAVEPKSSADREKMEQTLAAFVREDPTFATSVDPETGETLVHGMGELHLEVIQSRIAQEWNLEVRMGKPRVGYRETVGQAARGESKVDRELGGRVHYGHVVVEVRPDASAIAGPVVEFAVPETTIPTAFRAAVAEGAKSSASSGPLMGYPVINVRVVIVGGSTREGDASETGYTRAAAEATRHAIETAAPVLLEPIMRFQVTVPDQYFGDVLTDLQKRRADVADVQQTRDLRVLTGTVPLAETFGYTSDLRSISQGRGACSLEPDRYVPVPEQRRRELLGG